MELRTQQVLKALFLGQNFVCIMESDHYLLLYWGGIG